MANHPEPFRAFTIKHQGLSNRIVTDIEVSEAFDPQLSHATINGVQSRALWDTGATGSMISERIAAMLSLKPVGKMILSHAAGVESIPSYIVNLFLPNKVAIPGLVVGELRGKHDFDVIVGMDVIAAGDFALTNVNGMTCLSFRLPSTTQIDYVEEFKLYENAKPNDPCPCKSTDQSGKALKFKRCHGKP